MVDRSSIRGLQRSDPDLSPIRLGLAATLAWLMFFGLAHIVAHQTHGPQPLPFSPTRFAWTVLVNGTLMGLVLGGQASLKKAVVEDLRKLRPILPADAEDLGRLTDEIANVSAPIRRLATLVGMLGGLSVATLDPALREIHVHLAPLDPRYVAFIVQNMLFSALGARLFATEIHMTRAYARLGERVEVDLLDPSTALVFGGKGLRSVILWGSISTIFSMFWVLDSAGQANIALAIGVLALATAALVTPTLGVRRNIAMTKAKELAIVTRGIVRERDRALQAMPASPVQRPRPLETVPDELRLGSLLQYHAFVKSIREWPFDLSIVSRSSLFIVLGAGSWLGGAVVERILSLLLD
jgi:hypothetical protein